MKLATFEKQVTATVEINLSDLGMRFADDATPPAAGGPGALIIEARENAIDPIVLPATHPAVQALVAELTGQVTKRAEEHAAANQARRGGR
jgi:hypothetical protein